MMQVQSKKNAIRKGFIVKKILNVIAIVAGTFGILGQTVYSSEVKTSASIWKATYSALDADKAADFCRDTLGMEDIPVTDPDLREGHRWLRFGSDGTEIHFVTAKSEQQRSYLNSLISSLDYDSDGFQDWMNTHVGVWVDDLSPIIRRLQKTNTPFLGPVLRADGLYQLYVRVEGAGFLEFDSLTIPEEDYLPLVRYWYELWAKGNSTDPKKVIRKTDAYGGRIGTYFDTVSEGWLEGEKILAITINWGSYLHAIELVYDSNFSVDYGAAIGPHTGTLKLSDGEYITNGIVCTKNVSMGLSEEAKVVSFIKFFTSNGRQEYFGESSNDCFYMIRSEGFEVVGLHGKSSYRIESLGLSFRPASQ